MSKSNVGKTKSKAVALRYRSDEDVSPVVIASGYGSIADRIIGIGEERGIPIYKDDSAASMLCMLEVGRSIPTDLYEVVAAIYTQLLMTAQTAKQGGNLQPQRESSADAAAQLREKLRRRVTENIEPEDLEPKDK